MAGQMMERVAKQRTAGSQTMDLVFPTTEHNVYVFLGAGVFDVIVTWSGRPAIAVVHQLDGTSVFHNWVIKESTFHGERRGMVRLSSESPNQRFYLQSSGSVLESNLRCSVQVIPANLTFDFEVTTS